MRNSDVVQLLEDIVAALELKGESGYRIRAYQDAARNIGYLAEDVDVLCREGRLEEIPGVGPSIAEKIAGYLQTGHSPYLEKLIGEIPSGVFELLKVPGIGPSKANQLYRSLKITSLPELAQAAREHRIREVPGMGAKTESNILKEVERLSARSTRLPLSVAWPLAEKVAALLREVPGIDQVEPAGSIRRRRETIGDIDLLVASSDPTRVERALAELPITREVLWSGPTKVTILTRDHFQVDFRIIAPENWGAALQHFTGSKAHNIALRDRAIKMGYKVNEYGVFRLSDGKRIGGRTEEEVYDILGLAWMPPEIRENTGELEAAENGTLPRLVTLADIRGDLHAHTRFSDGRNSLDEMVEAAIARGYDFLVVTDHSHGLGVTHGLTPEKVREQRRLIDTINQRVAPFRVLAGVELEIRATGELDFPDEILAAFDLVGASIHSGTKQPPEQITARMLRALANPHVHILNHPSGRLLSRRPPYEFDLDAVIEAARQYGKALEIDGSFDRMDLRDVAARHAHEQGVTLALSSDAHSIEGFDDMRFAVAIARRAWLEPKDVLNTLSPQALLKRFKKPVGGRRR